jgi:hypothetical protein
MGIQITCDSCKEIIKNDTYDICKLCNPKIIICNDCAVSHIVKTHLDEVIQDKLYEFYERVNKGYTIAEKMKIDVKNGRQKSLVKI